MKYKLSSAGLLLFICFAFRLSVMATETEVNAGSDTVKVLTSPELIPLVNTWAEKFSALYTSAEISVIPVKNSMTVDHTSITIGMETGDNGPGTGQGWNMVVGHNALIAVINNSNPLKSLIAEHGISPGKLAGALAQKNSSKWPDILGGSQDVAVNFYCYSGNNIREILSGFAGSATGDLNVTEAGDVSEFIKKMDKDVYSIGFCRLSDIKSLNSTGLMGNLSFLPIDRNGNGRIDSFESIYGNPEELMRGIWTGKYPSGLSGRIIASCAGKPAGKSQIAFLSWIITDGSSYMSENGYITLAGIEKEAGISSLNTTPVLNEAKTSPFLGWSIILGSVIALVILITVLVTRKAKAEKGAVPVARNEKSAFNENIILSPNGLFYDKSHTWAFMERDGLVRIGADDFIQHITGIITGIRVKEPGEFVRRGEKIISIVKEGKQIDLYSPVSGVIKSLNTTLLADPSVYNSAPCSDGWFYLVEPGNWAREIQLMFSADKYRQWLKDEFARLKTFLGTIMKENSAGAYVIMQDGGEMTDNLLADFGPEAWEDFQRRFIDISR
jgi:glycine cleavage system H lipoate-binding protein